jgi:hypothetical protein
MSTVAATRVASAPVQPSSLSAGGRLLQRKCACGAPKTPLGKTCEDCRPHGLQRKLSMGASNDPLEAEADRIADQVLAMPTRPGVSSAPAQVQRVAEQPAGQSGAVPASVEQVLAGPGRPLEPSLRQDMEQRFGHDFSQVRVHVDERAAKSAEAIGASAYTLGQQVVFGRGRFNPSSGAGRRLIAHELTHTLQQRGASGTGPTKAPAADHPASRTPDPRSALTFTPSGLQVTRQRSDDISDDINLIKARILVVTLLRLFGRTPATPRSQTELNAEARVLAEEQWKRKQFWEAVPNGPEFVVDAFLRNEKIRNKMQELNINWDPDEREFHRNKIVDVMEHDVMFNTAAKRIYDSALWDLDVNRPEEKSTFDRVVGAICEHTNPCHDNMEQFRRDRAGGMSVEEARGRGLWRLVAAFWPSKGPQGPIQTGSGPVAPPGGTRFSPFEAGNLRPVPATNGPTPALRSAQPPRPALPTPIPIPKPTAKPPPARAPEVTPGPDSVAPPKAAGPKPPATAAVRPPRTTPRASPRPAPATESTPVPFPGAPQTGPRLDEPDQRRRGCGSPDLPLTQVSFFPGPLGQGGKVTASPLTRCPGNTVGSAPLDSIYKAQFECIDKDPEERGKWVRGHILHGKTGRSPNNLHGPGDTEKNLIIIDKSLNGSMNSWIEQVVLKLVYGPYPHVIWYSAWVDSYHPGLPYFADSISVAYGPYDTKSKTELPAWKTQQFLMKDTRTPPHCPAGMQPRR